ncbi:MAG TPA: class I SAM-dependent methyltransferase [Thermoanaerobaculia bacterium]|nr:class I SAM-dependent methyltransferase [Thermoanaerobaculia bacterium]
MDACAACGGERFRATTIAGVTVKRCIACGLRTSAISPGRQLNYADVDDRAYLQSIGRVRRAQAEVIVAFVRKHGGGGDWLDVGCGYGYVLDAARAGGFAVRGIEPDAKAAAAARERIGNVEQGLLDERTEAADVLSTLDVIEHLHDLDAFAQLAARKARRFWVIKVPSSDGLFYKVAHALRIGGAVRRLWQSEYEHPHTVYFDERTLTRFLNRNGFDVVAKRYLDEVPDGTVVDRLTLDGRMPRWKAALAVPVFFVINVVERIRGKSDALLVIARHR